MLLTRLAASNPSLVLVIVSYHQLSSIALNPLSLATYQQLPAILATLQLMPKGA